MTMAAMADDLERMADEALFPELLRLSKGRGADEALISFVERRGPELGLDKVRRNRANGCLAEKM